MYAITFTNRRGQPDGLLRDTPYLGLAWDRTRRAALNVAVPLRDARRFGSPPDADCFHGGELLGSEYFAVVGLLPWALAEATAAAEHQWNHRNCHPATA